jgi:hypothetical protein
VARGSTTTSGSGLGRVAAITATRTASRTAWDW